MTEKERMLNGDLYLDTDPELLMLLGKSKHFCARYNRTRALAFKKREMMLRRFLKSIGKNVCINPPFYCDYGCHISVGDNFFANFDCILLDVNTITIGNNVLFGPRVCLFTAGHPLDAGVRRELLEFGKPIVIGDDVWIGGNVTVNPGVTIGSNVVIGSGSVVTKDIPSGVVAAGNPCRVLRELTDKDRAEWEAQKQAYWDSKK